MRKKQKQLVSSSSKHTDGQCMPSDLSSSWKGRDGEGDRRRSEGGSGAAAAATTTSSSTTTTTAAGSKRR